LLKILFNDVAGEGATYIKPDKPEKAAEKIIDYFPM
jgi:hypothetical protein